MKKRRNVTSTMINWSLEKHRWMNVRDESTIGSITEIVVVETRTSRKNESRSLQIASIRRSIKLRPELLAGAQSRGRILTNKERPPGDTIVLYIVSYTAVIEYNSEDRNKLQLWWYRSYSYHFVSHLNVSGRCFSRIS